MLSHPGPINTPSIHTCVQAVLKGTLQATRTPQPPLSLTLGCFSPVPAVGPATVCVHFSVPLGVQFHPHIPLLSLFILSDCYPRDSTCLSSLCIPPWSFPGPVVARTLTTNLFVFSSLHNITGFFQSLTSHRAVLSQDITGELSLCPILPLGQLKEKP